MTFANRSAKNMPRYQPDLLPLPCLFFYNHFNNMFFMIGITDREKELAYSGRLIACPGCGRLAGMQVYMTYTVLLLFFIPCFRWNRRYYVRTSCCGSVFELSYEKGEMIRRGEPVDISEYDLNTVYRGRSLKRCSQCGYETDEDFDFCPKCGQPLS